VWPMRAPAAMYECGLPLPGHPSARAGPATRTGVSEHARVCQGTAAKEESRSPIRGTEESDRAASSAPAGIEVRARAVPPCSGGTEHQTAGPLSKPTDSTAGSHHLEDEEINSVALPGTHKIGSSTEFFNTHRRLHSLRIGRCCRSTHRQRMDSGAVESQDTFGREHGS